MEIEFVEFYPIHKKKPGSKLIGTIHVYVCDKNLDLKGIKIFKCGKSFFVKVPGTKGKDIDTKKDVHYPYASFCGEEQEDFIASLRKVASNELKKLFKKKDVKKPHTKQP